MGEAAADNYQVNIPLFEGPLDLLLHLVTKNRIDIHDIPIHLITDQYLAYLESARQFNLDLGSSFFAMASTLILIKSRMLLPEKGGRKWMNPRIPGRNFPGPWKSLSG